MKDSSDQKDKVLQFLQSDHLTQPTSKVLVDRLQQHFHQPKFFNESQSELLAKVAQLLMGEDSEDYNQKMAGFIDERLYLNKSDGWRYDEMPPDQEMYVKGLSGINEISFLVFKKDFQSLETHNQIEVLTKIQNGTAEGNSWPNFSSKIFFEELLAEVSEIYYSFPEIQLEMGYAGMADHGGWTELKLDDTEPVEQYVTEQFSQNKI